MLLADRLTLDAPKRTNDGYLAVRARAGRSGVYDYLASEVGAPDSFKPNDTVKVYRDDVEVFATDSVRSFVGRPITNDHPTEAVTADNWKRHARGTIMGAMRDGDYLAFDLVLMDADAIRAVDGGKRELSNGYQCQLDWTPGTAPDGTKYDARQVGIRGNHVALVDAGRAGSNCAIKDGVKFALCDANPAALAALTQEKNVKTITLDGLPVKLDDADAVEAAFKKLTDRAAAADKALSDAKAEHDKAMAAKDAEIEKAKALADKAIADADAKADIVGRAKAIVGDKLGDTAGKSVADVRRMTVAAKLGDAAVTDKSDDYVAARFDILADEAKPADPLRKVIADGVGNTIANDAEVASTIRMARYA